MKIHGTELFFIDETDIDENDVLNIPEFVTSISYNLARHLQWRKLKHLARTVNGQQHLYPVAFHDGEIYIILDSRRVMGLDIKTVADARFDLRGVCGATHKMIKYNGQVYVADTLEDTITDIRADIWHEKIFTVAAQQRAPAYAADIISNALNQTIIRQKSRHIGVPLRSHIDAQIDNLPAYLHGINMFCAKYQNNETLDELSHLSLDELANIILPIKSQNIGKSYTRFVKSTPDNAQHLHAAMVAGFKNPGCFPYDWISNIPKPQRGAATDALHRAFRTATMKLYTPVAQSYSFMQSMYSNVLDALAGQIERITHVPVKIEYFGHGFFSKTYKITSERESYILKVYHSDLPYQTSQMYAHDIEAQNSFLVSGKKYCGKIRYRRVLTAGISNQRGQRYILYPFVEGEPENITHNPYDCFKVHQFCDDIGEGNLCGDTIIDIGMVKTNPERIGRPYMTKIINTVLYRPWDDLAIVLNKYSPTQITYTINYMLARLTPSVPNHQCISAKIEFLRNKLSNCR